MYVQIAIGVLVLASFVLAYFAARTWHWGHVLIVVGIVLSSVGFFLLAGEVLRINAVLRSQVVKLERDLANVEARNDALLNGTTDGAIIGQLQGEEVKIPEGAESVPSIADLEHQLHLETRLRGRVWRNVAPAGFDPQTGTVTLGVESPTPSGIAANTVVFLFEQGEPQPPAANGAPRGPQYLGEFRVSEAAGQQAKLLPVMPLDQFERQRLSASRGPWTLYEVMPADRQEIFKNMTEDDLKAKMPRQSIDEYVRHGKEAKADDDEWHRLGVDENGEPLRPDDIGKAAKVLYQRRMRDYALEFDQLAERRASLQTDIDGVKRDIDRLNKALASAKELQTTREGEIQNLRIDLAGVTKERDAINAHLKQVQQQLARAQTLLAETLQRNRQLMEQLAARQNRSSRAGDPASAVETPGPLALDRR